MWLQISKMLKSLFPGGRGKSSDRDTVQPPLASGDFPLAVCGLKVMEAYITRWGVARAEKGGKGVSGGKNIGCRLIARCPMGE